MKIILFVLLMMSADVHAWTASPSNLERTGCGIKSSDEIRKLPPQTCVGGRVYELKYVHGRGQIILRSARRESVLKKIPRGFDPSLVGGESLIGFLPDALQPYRTKNIVAYVSTIRSTGGNGRGQCGAGVEIYLNFLDLSLAFPKVKSSILIGSCEKPIELMEQDLSESALGDVSVVAGRLTLRFLSYPDLEGYPVCFCIARFQEADFYRRSVIAPAKLPSVSRSKTS